MDKKDLSERDICTKYITPALKLASWDELTQLREEVSFTKGRIIVRGKLVTRGKASPFAANSCRKTPTTKPPPSSSSGYSWK